MLEILIVFNGCDCLEDLANEGIRVLFGKSPATRQLADGKESGNLELANLLLL